ncbi:polyprenyl diphosphate synthase, partial [Candidatus Parcubacteria bacterium]|nr:polyprenyl diphosphate synthase [Candidatus Parcubacteria bacterium]
MNSEDKKNTIPNHVGVIIDGNRRWARERNLTTMEGHLKGYQKMKLAPDWFFSSGVKILSVFAFSTENWSRSRDEVNYLMKLIKKAINEEAEDADKKGYRVLVSGRVDELPGDLPESCYNAINKTKTNTKAVLNICLNYGGRAEIVDAMRKMLKNNIKLEQIHEGMIKKYLYNGDLGDPDIIVRTSGEQRLSGFQLWQ